MPFEGFESGVATWWYLEVGDLVSREDGSDFEDLCLIEVGSKTFLLMPEAARELETPWKRLSCF